MKARVYLSWVALSSLASCGLAPGDEGAIAFPTDGVAGFGEAAPVEVCLGPARVVAPALATGATALCVPEGSLGKSCGGNGECVGIERCVCGRCVVEPCQGAGSCEGDLVCRGRRCTTPCSADTDCAKGERCVSGGCARSCGSDGDCHHGERCDALDDVCVVSLCGSGGTCGAKTQCEAVALVGELGEPSFVGGEPLAFVELSRGGASAIHRVIVDGPISWRIDPEEPVLEMAGETRVGAPSVIRRGSSLELYAAVGSPSQIVRALSSDGGKTFTVDAALLLSAAEPWENGVVGSPSAFDFDGTTYLYYEGGEGAGIGLAKIDGKTAVRFGKNPALVPFDVEDAVFWRDIVSVGSPHALVLDGAPRLFFTARGVEGLSATVNDGTLPAEPNDSIGLAATTDFQSYSFFPTGPVYARLVNLRAYLGEREAFVRPLDSGAEMVFVSADASGEGVTGIYRAVSSGVGGD